MAYTKWIICNFQCNVPEKMRYVECFICVHYLTLTRFYFHLYFQTGGTALTSYIYSYRNVELYILKLVIKRY